MPDPEAQVELLRRREDGALISWLLNEDGTQPSSDAEAHAHLVALVDRLDTALTRLQTLIDKPVGPVGLDTATLQALEDIRATVLNWPASFPLPFSQITELKPLPHPGVYPLPSDQLAVLEPDPIPSTFPLPTAQLDSLKLVTVANQPQQMPIPSAQVADLKQVTVTNPTPATDVTNLATEPTAARTATASEKAVRPNAARFDYGTRGDKRPVRIGIAPPGTANTSAQWTVFNLDWDVSNRVTAIYVSENQVWA